MTNGKLYELKQVFTLYSNQNTFTYIYVVTSDDHTVTLEFGESYIETAPEVFNLSICITNSYVM